MNGLDPAPLMALLGREESRAQVLDAASVARFAAALGLPHDAAMPPLAHWAFFNDTVADDQLGADGHPARGRFLPDVPGLDRRMFAAADLRFAAPLRLGEPARLTLEIADLRHRTGGTGDLFFVDVDRRIEQHGALCIAETQTLVYRAAAALQPELPTPTPAGPTGAETWLPGHANLFRFSAATFNAHRIHYDLAYATEVERYPDLVVHGPFIAAKLALLASRRGDLAGFRFRATALCFVGQPIRLIEDEPGSLRAIRCDGIGCMEAKASYR